MSDSQSELISQLLKKLAKIDYIKPGEFPNIHLYMDQVTTFMNSHLSDFKLQPDEKTLTKTMINNYAKNNLIPPPVKKKYSKEHMVLLTFIYYFKNILSISEIQDMLSPLTDKFFDSSDNSGGLSMEYVYNEVYATVKSQISTISEDISTKITAYSEHFAGVRDEDDRKFLQTFSMICMLGFDVFMKKQVIQNLIASVKSDKAEEKKEASRKEAREDKKEASRKEASKKDSKESKKGAGPSEKASRDVKREAPEQDAGEDKADTSTESV